MSRTAPQSFPATLVTHAIPQSSLHSFIRHRTQSIRTPHTSPFLICQDPLRNPSPPRSSPMLSPNPPAIHSSGIALNRSARRTQSPSSYVKTRSAILPRHARHPCYPRILPPFIHQASHSIDPHAAAALFFGTPLRNAMNAQKSCTRTSLDGRFTGRPAQVAGRAKRC